MTTRLDFLKSNPADIKAMMGVEEQISKGSLDVILKELVRLRASQIDGARLCASLDNKFVMEKLARGHGKLRTMRIRCCSW